MTYSFSRKLDHSSKGVGGLEDPDTKLGVGVAVLGVSAMLYGAVVATGTIATVAIGAGALAAAGGVYMLAKKSVDDGSYVVDGGGI